jgi:hypothetical protein
MAIVLARCTGDEAVCRPAQAAAEHSCRLLVSAVTLTLRRPSGGTVFGEALELTVTLLPGPQPQQRQHGFPVGGCLDACAGQPGAHGIHGEGSTVAQVESQQLARM